jgi:hypothetical protein
MKGEFFYHFSWKIRGNEGANDLDSSRFKEMNLEKIKNKVC